MTIPELDLDLFCDASLRDPFAGYQRLQDDGLVVKLSWVEASLGTTCGLYGFVNLPFRLS